MYSITVAPQKKGELYVFYSPIFDLCMVRYHDKLPSAFLCRFTDLPFDRGEDGEDLEGHITHIIPIAGLYLGDTVYYRTCLFNPGKNECGS